MVWAPCEHYMSKLAAKGGREKRPRVFLVDWLKRLAPYDRPSIKCPRRRRARPPSHASPTQQIRK